VDDVSLDVQQGTITALIGPNGSGKTTLFNVISGWYLPDLGDIRLFGSGVVGLAPHQVFGMGLYRTFQSPHILPSLSVLENLLIADRRRIGEGSFDSVFRRGVWRRHEDQIIERAYEYLKLLGLENHANEPPTILSGGQLKLLELGRALMSEARVLLLDEPAAGVNPTLAAKVFDFLEHMRRELGVTLFVIEHKMELVLERVDYVFVMNKGRVFFSGTPDAVREEHSVVDIYLGV